MKITTAQLAIVKPRGHIVDITVKSGVKAFAPTWDMVMGYKRGTLSIEEYTKVSRHDEEELSREQGRVGESDPHRGGRENGYPLLLLPARQLLS